MAEEWSLIGLEFAELWILNYEAQRQQQEEGELYLNYGILRETTVIDSGGIKLSGRKIEVWRHLFW